MLLTGTRMIFLKQIWHSTPCLYNFTNSPDSHGTLRFSRDLSQPGPRPPFQHLLQPLQTSTPPHPPTEHLIFPNILCTTTPLSPAHPVSPYREGPPNPPYLPYLFSQPSDPLPLSCPAFAFTPPCIFQGFFPHSLRQSLEFCRPCSYVSHRQLLKPRPCWIIKSTSFARFFSATVSSLKAVPCLLLHPYSRVWV